MAPKASSATTARDLELLVLAWQSLKTAPQVDYDLFAQKAGYKNAATAATQFHTLKKKVFALALAADGSSTDKNNNNTASAPSTPKSATPRKRAAAKAATMMGDDVAADSTPTKKPRAKKQEEKKKVKTEMTDGEEDVGDAEGGEVVKGLAPNEGEC
ncbi:hypothetical protein Micbo1qcDRAFT_200025 [Microdochium bolleyi]|uniref:Uncharacterized protein n=1 Tax=Microdochium bolleyi TaxID=196109 RepID=A0A136JKR5_9PEZI|nr:hypothetical protein Micbo1qcDRAFT_200025 [Microdochium bolleyi]